MGTLGTILGILWLMGVVLFVLGVLGLFRGEDFRIGVLIIATGVLLASLLPLALGSLLGVLLLVVAALLYAGTSRTVRALALEAARSLRGDRQARR